uniref:NADH-ubiquinone oxidoreductase chain 1 n=1 Tax=Siphonodentalium lobatum TaxID=203167 RepID=Q6VEI0_9MOLL|nr:NADH dehydrogenase subunit 1 [Siphonodentalium lobatum]AAP91668.1 NADH dehydrogenase subunit 1 [Siphonodentalium lobatum]
MDIFGYIELLIMAVMVLLTVSFYTIVERKCLSYAQSRKGPNKVVFLGLLQAVADGVKLLSKSMNEPFKSNFVYFTGAPMVMLGISLTCWYFLPGLGFKSAVGPILLVLCLFGVNVYCLIFSGWCSYSSYSMIGCVRAVAQSVSYEVCSFFSYCAQQLLEVTFFLGSSTSFFFSFLFIVILWMFVCMAETNRAPFDFAEGESELVSGFNVEYGSSLFTLIFLAEYGFILFLSSLTVSLFFPHSFYLMWSMVLSLVFIYSRGSLPRFRYDLLMMFSWKIILPLSIVVLMVGSIVVCI